MPHHADVGEVAQVLTVAEAGKRLVQLREGARHADARLDVVKQLQLRRLQRLVCISNVARGRTAVERTAVVGAVAVHDEAVVEGNRRAGG